MSRRRPPVRPHVADWAFLLAMALLLIAIGAPNPSPAQRTVAGPASRERAIEAPLGEAPGGGAPAFEGVATPPATSGPAPTAPPATASALRLAIPDRPRAPWVTTTTTTVPPTTTTTLPPGAVKLPASGPPLVVYNIATPDPVVFVTIDDGWTNDPSVLSFIRDHNWPVTAFLIDRVASATVPFWQQLQSFGGVVEDHTVNHPALRGRSAASQQGEICPPADDYQRLFGRRPTLFRPPYGSWDGNTVTAAGACGLRAVVLWNVVIDQGKFSRATVGPLSAGDIVLLHWGPALHGDLQRLSDLMAAAGLHPALLENYLRAP
jgi:peptidoglycan/xylan/chitin deacetylase (PgdA/CDA1 family)